MPKTTFTSVDDYIGAQPEAVQSTLERVRGIIRRVLPDAEESISYQIPAYKQHGTYVVYLSGAKQHFALHPATEGLIEALGDELTPHLAGKGTMRFSWSAPVPTRLIQRITRILAKEAAARAGAKTTKRRA